MRNKSDNMLIKTLKALALVAIVAIAFFAGSQISKDSVKPQTVLVTKTEVRYQTVEKPILQHVAKPVVEYVKLAGRTPAELRNFNDLDELKRWVGNRMNATTIRFQSSKDEVDCDDYAREMQSAALADGYIVSFQIIGRSEYNALFKNKLPSSQPLHAINLAIIGNDIHYIEPQTGEITFAMRLD